MAYCEVNHACTLSAMQQQRLAQAITGLLRLGFSANPQGVSVVFNDMAAAPHYVGGELVRIFPGRPSKLVDRTTETDHPCLTAIR